jgi:hypothetical protein
MIRLKQSTASQEVPLGPFVQIADGGTLMDALGPIAASDIKIWKNGGTTMANASGGTAAFMVDGTYVVVLDATDTNTVGPLVIVVTPAGARPIRVECEVMLPEAFDLAFGATLMPRLVASLNGKATGITHESTPCTTTTITVTGIGGGIVPTPTVADQLKDKLIVFTDIATNPAAVKGVATRIIGQTVGPPIVLTIDPIPAGCVPGTLNSFVIEEGKLPPLTPAGHIKASVEALQESVTAATNLRKQGLVGGTATLSSGSTTQVLQISAGTTPAMVDANQLRGRVVLIIDESGSEAALKLQGGRVSTSTTTSITLEQPLTRAPAAGNLLIIV